ncbi:MAG: CRISPR-associated endoribonuclease Cas2 [Saprospiraceae bacterium]|nr:CRISPR-associated endoribonuclease Cas2 [Saprospiraceae bacterium]
MYAWVIYDIRKNRTRSRVAKRCKFYGLARVQKSVFLGKLKGKWVKALHAELSNAINQRTDRLFVVPMNDENFSRVLQTGTPPALPDMVNDSKLRFLQ